MVGEGSSTISVRPGLRWQQSHQRTVPVAPGKQDRRTTNLNIFLLPREEARPGQRRTTRCCWRNPALADGHDRTRWGGFLTGARQVRLKLAAGPPNWPPLQRKRFMVSRQELRRPSRARKYGSSTEVAIQTDAFQCWYHSSEAVASLIEARDILRRILRRAEHLALIRPATWARYHLRGKRSFASPFR